MSWKRRAIQMLLGDPTADRWSSLRRSWSDQRALERAHRASCRRAASLGRTGELRCHFGCGHNYRPGWVNIDQYHFPPCTSDLVLDLRQPLPFPDNSCAELYSEHFLEHLSYPAGAMHHLRESIRVLRPGGRMSVGVPDPGPILQAYLEGLPSPYFEYCKTHGSVDRFVETPMEAVNWLFRQKGEHQFIYDYPTLEKVLAKAGYVGVARRDFDPARDSADRRDETLYVDAHKPSAPELAARPTR